MIRKPVLAAWLVIAASSPVALGEGVVIRVSDPGGVAGRMGAPVSVDAEAVLGEGGGERFSAGYLVELAGGDSAGAGGPRVPVQFERLGPEGSGRLWWIMPAGPSGDRRFRFVPEGGQASPVWRVVRDEKRQQIELWEGPQPVLRYNHGPVPVPRGTPPHFAAGERYERGDYISPLYGPHGEVLTEDYPADHPHHRGIWWSWPMTRWKDRVADIWAVVGVWSRPVALRRAVAGPVFAVIEAENVWKFGKQEVPIVREEVLIRAFRRVAGCRFVDVEVSLTALADGVAIGGRPYRGYGGFALRAAPARNRRITRHTDPSDASPRRSWLDYSGVFARRSGMAGVTIFEHVTNPDYPNPLHEYPECNCVMPAYPEMRQVGLSQERPLVLKHRLWVHVGGPDERRLADAWDAYARPPRVELAASGRGGAR